MVQSAPPSHSFTALNNVLRAGTLPLQTAGAILSSHREELFRAVTVSVSERTLPSSSSEIRYRVGSSTTKSHPKPTSSELASIESIAKGLGISRSEAAVLLRDYLAELKEDAVGEIIEHCDNFEVVAPFQAVEQFWQCEKRNAFSCLVTICAGASQSSTHIYYQLFTSFLAEHEEKVKEIVLKGASVTIKSFLREDGKVSTETFSDIQHWWVMEALFSLCMYTNLSATAKEHLLRDYSSVFQARTSLSLGPEKAILPSYLDGKEATVLLAASLNLSNGLVIAVQAENEGMDLENEVEEGLKAATLAKDDDAIQRIDGIILSMKESQAAEAVIMSFSWAVFLKLRPLIASIGFAEQVNSLGPDPVEHLSSALSRNVFGALGAFATADLEVDELISREIYHSFWADIVGLLLAFPPQNFSPLQVQEVTELSTNVLSRTALDSWRETAESLWEREGTEVDMVGVNCLLRLASGVYPQVFRPLISLLTSLSMSQNSARRAFLYLQRELISLTESSDTYQESLLVLDQSEDSEIWRNMTIGTGARFEDVFRKLQPVCPGDGNIAIVQAMEDLPPDSYQVEMKKGSLGVANHSLTVVTWIKNWNGFKAVDHVMRVLLGVLRDHDAKSMFGDRTVNELLQCGMESLKLLDRLCRTGSKALRDALLKNTDRIGLVCGIWAELADPGDWVKESWLTKRRREILLTASSSCISSMAMGSATRAGQALEHICSSKNTFPLHASLSSLGANAFPAVAAVSRLAGLCSNTEHMSDHFVRKLSMFSRSSETNVPSYTLEGCRGGTDRVYNFLRAVALPLWLTTSVMRDASEDAKSLHWLLPACSLQLFSNRPNDVLSDPAVSSVLVRVVMGAAAPSPVLMKPYDRTDTFLFPALRAALLACYEALRNRNASFHDFQETLVTNSGRNEYATAADPELGLTALEKLLVKPDVIQAFAILSSGGSERLRHSRFFSASADSEFRSFLPDIDPHHYMFLNVNTNDTLTETVRSWRVWVEDMCTRCLSLLFCGLSQSAKGGDIIQVPWPTTDRSSTKYWRGGGEWIRTGYAERISEGSIAVIELMVAVLSCGQRAAARSLMGPRPKKVRFSRSLVTGSEEQAPKVDAEVGNPPISLGASQGRLSGASKSTGTSEVLSSIVNCLEENFRTWTAKTSNSRNVLDEDGSDATVELGQIALSIVASVRFLRIGWESYSSKWFQDCWKSLQVWGLLAKLLRCEPARSSGNFDLGQVLDSQNKLPRLRLSEGSKNIPGSASTEKLVLKEGFTVDLATAWKAIASDCLHVFSSEILLRAGESLVSPQAFSSPNSEHKESKVSIDVFKGEPFTQFAAVFTERWMHLLLHIDESYLQGYSCLSATTPKEAKRKRSDLNGLRRGREETVEERSQSLSSLLGRSIGLSEREAEKSRILYDFRRTGDIRTRFGADYAFNIPAILRFMRALDVDVDSHQNLFMDILRLNVELCRKDVQVDAVNAFSAMASAVLFADAFAPSQSAALTYSSPQFGGKLTRFLSRLLVCIIPSVSSSRHTVSIVVEVSKLLATLSANLSSDELEQPALTAIRFTHTPRQAERECSLSTLGQICVCIRSLIESVQGESTQESLNDKRLDSARWLLLASSRLVAGASFRSLADVAELAKTAIDAMQCPKALPALFSAASVAISAVLENSRDIHISTLFDASRLEDLFAAIASLAKFSTDRASSSSACRSAASLLLNITQIHILSRANNTVSASCIFRHLSGGSVLAFLPPVGESISTYESNFESRSASHLLWCACLHLSSVTMPKEPQPLQAQFDEEGLRAVMEFCAIGLVRISRDSLDLSGDWPPPLHPNSEELRANGEGSLPQKHLTIGRVEEAEAAAVCLYRLSVYALPLQEALPDLLQAAIAELVLFTHQVYRLIRAEPVERWVRPVTQRERDRSALLRSGRENITMGTPSRLSPAPWSATPVKQGSANGSTPSRRSPSQALRAAIGGGNNTGTRMSQGFLPPSPGMPPTPQQSPITPGPGPYGASYCSPGSPWGPYGSGLITTTGIHFGEEVSRSLLRALWFALAALRKFSDVMDVLLFKPTMTLGEDSLGLGVLVAILYHACNEVCRGAEDDRREALVMIVDNALYLTITHVTAYNEQGQLTQAARDELWKRVGTVRSRMRKVVPPAPSFSIIHSKELEVFLQQVKGSS